ncbi:coiled-coil domain-containing protein 115-like [Actinia tenebrosa]|uniref:Vacuolar ATPase assembly protein VMA22 n=1 Tax=Actinia tenebrosa TaxID=6105 RepID=A0A6P8I452_ACTTE|nr:coiled-coil domain-containing protein 115-like [Actinia tenebrosa]
MADDSVAEKLDDLTLEFFEKFESLQRKREELSKAMRDGYLNLSQARYSMGNKAVGPLQYSSRMQALVSVYENNAMQFELQKNIPGHSENKKEDQEDESSSSGLRKRKGTLPSKENGEISESVDDNLAFGVQEIELSDMKKKDKTVGRQETVGKDPLKWFGVLVPMCLRTGQNDFRSAIDLCCDLVNLENEMKDLMKNFREFKALKHKQQSTEIENE